MLKGEIQMHEPTESLYSNITLNAIQLASAYYPILIEMAKQKHCLITYGDLVDRAKENHPNKEVVQNAIAVSTGKKLDVIRIFTSERGLPDVTSLVINKKLGECGSRFTENFDPEKAREKVYQYNWEEVSTEFDIYIKGAEKNAMPRKKRTRESALEEMSRHYSANKQSYPPSIKEKREEIIVLLMEGLEVEECFKQVISV